MSDPNTSTSPALGLAIGEVSQQTGIPIETLRFYDRSGLLGELPRTAGGHRVFDELSLGLLDVVVRLRRTGMPVEDVRAFVERVRADRDRTGRIELLRRHRDRVAGRLDQLQSDLAVIDWKITAYTANEAGRPAPPPPPGWPGTSRRERPRSGAPGSVWTEERADHASPSASDEGRQSRPARSGAASDDRHEEGRAS